jgi:hypothetical protein
MWKFSSRVVHSRLFRWSLTAFAAVILAATVASWFRSASCGVEFATERLWSRYSASFSSGRIWLCATPHASACFRGPPAEPEFWSSIGGDPSSPLNWRRVPSSPVGGYHETYSTNGTEYWYYSSGFIPATVAGLPALILWRRRRRHPKDGCPSCGYSRHGLTAAECPECGRLLPPVSDASTSPTTSRARQ